MLGDSGAVERSALVNNYLPYIGHILPQVVLLETGGVMAMARVDGAAFELESNDERNSRLRRLNTIYRNIADNNVEIYTHFVRRYDTEPTPERKFISNFAASLNEAYQSKVIKGKVFKNEYLVSMVVQPRNALGKWAAQRTFQFNKKKASSFDNLVRELEDQWVILQSGLDIFGCKRLGIYEHNGFEFTEIGEALHLIITGLQQRVPLVSGHLGDSLYTNRVICGKRGIEIRFPGKSAFGSIFSFREYPAKTRPGMLNEVLSLPFPCVVTQSFCFNTRAETQEQLSLKKKQMNSAEDKAGSQILGLDKAADDIASSEIVMGNHHFSLAIYGHSVAEVEENGGKARGKLADTGSVIVQEQRGLEAAFWSQLPGNVAWRTRPGSISSRNFSALSSLDNFPVGSKVGHWGNAIATFKTTSGTTYDYTTHVVDVGMTIIFGRTGSGKTAFAMFLLAMAEQSMISENSVSGATGSIVFFDKDRGGELLVRASNGTYIEIRQGVDSGMNPLRRLGNDPSDSSFLLKWITALIESDERGAISSDELDLLTRAIGRQLRMPPEMRSLGGVREFLGYSDPNGCGARLDKWCSGKALGWAFDGDTDNIDLTSSLTGIDMTQILEHEEVCAPAAAYILHHVTKLLDGRRVLVAIDEFRFYIRNKRFARLVDDLLLTVRKKNGSVLILLQQPEHILGSDIGASIVAQCFTKIFFSSPTANRDAYTGDASLGCTEQEYRAVREVLAVGKRKFLLKRETGSVICEFDLGSLPEYIAILSSRANTVRFVEKLRQDVGDNADLWLPIFMSGYHKITD